MATLQDELIANSEEFRRLAQEHKQYAQRLDSLIQKRYLSEDEKVEEVRLKKLKLRLKDQMEIMEQQHRRQAHRAGLSPQPARAIPSTATAPRRYRAQRPETAPSPRQAAGQDRVLCVPRSEA